MTTGYLCSGACKQTHLENICNLRALLECSEFCSYEVENPQHQSSLLESCSLNWSVFSLKPTILRTWTYKVESCPSQLLLLFQSLTLWGLKPPSSIWWGSLGLAPRHTLFASNFLTSRLTFRVPGSQAAREPGLHWTQLHSSFQNPASQPPVCFNPRWKSAPISISILNCNPP